MTASQNRLPETKNALILSGGAPNATLMAGALSRLHEEGVRFDVISVSGAGTAVGLGYLVPKGIDEIMRIEDREEREEKLTELRISALRASTSQGVEDLLFRLLPLNFKVFQKPGRMAEAYRKITRPWVGLAHQWLDSVFERIEPLRDRLDTVYDQLHPQTAGEQERRKLMREFVQRVASIKRFDEKLFAHDLIDLWHALLSPTWLTPKSEGLCAHPPQLDEFVMIDQLRNEKLDVEFYMNSYNLTKREMQIFPREDITRDHFYAALAYPFFYPPYQMPNGDYHIEGAAIDALNFKSLLQTSSFIRSILVIDVAGKRNLMHKPRDLFDAFAQSIMTPLIEVARDDTKIFEQKMKDEQEGRDALQMMMNVGEFLKNFGFEPPADAAEALDYYINNPPEVLKLPVEMSDEEWQRSMEWATSNLETQFELGYKSAGEFVKTHPQLKSSDWRSEQTATPT